MFVESRAGDARDVCEINALIRIPSRDDAIACLVVDISVRGARLIVDPVIDLPQKFILALPLIDEASDERHVELRWRRGGANGVRFMPQA